MEKGLREKVRQELGLSGWEGAELGMRASTRSQSNNLSKGRRMQEPGKFMELVQQGERR